MVVILVDGERWVEVETLANSGPDDTHFVVKRSGDASEIRFGDGRQGRRPPAGATFDVTAYATGGGAAGNTFQLPVLEGGTVVIRTYVVYGEQSDSDSAANAASS